MKSGGVAMTGVLAHTVGYGGSEARSVGRWLRRGRHVALADVLGFFVVLATVGWVPHEAHKAKSVAPGPASQAALACRHEA
jgi:hypothetical protein